MVTTAGSGPGQVRLVQGRDAPAVVRNPGDARGAERETPRASPGFRTTERASRPCTSRTWPARFRGGNHPTAGRRRGWGHGGPDRRRPQPRRDPRRTPDAPDFGGGPLHLRDRRQPPSADAFSDAGTATATKEVDNSASGSVYKGLAIVPGMPKELVVAVAVPASLNASVVGFQPAMVPSSVAKMKRSPLKSRGRSGVRRDHAEVEDDACRGRHDPSLGAGRRWNGPPPRGSGSGPGSAGTGSRCPFRCPKSRRCPWGRTRDPTS